MTPKILNVSLTWIVLFVLAVSGQAQSSRNTCDENKNDPPWGKEVQDLPSIWPDDGVLDTSLVIRKQDICVPVWTQTLCEDTYLACTDDSDCSDGVQCENARTCVGGDFLCSGNGDCRVCVDNGGTKTCQGSELACTTDDDCQDQRCVDTWGWQEQNLRTYGFPRDPEQAIDPADPEDPNIEWGHPGPILHARAETLATPTRRKGAANEVSTPGTRIKLALYNYLEPQDFHSRHDCEPAGYKICSNDPTRTCNVDTDCKDNAPCEPPVNEIDDETPNCFHGSETTNLHYHGTHVSPQPHQDYVLLSLFPFGSTNVPDDQEQYKKGMYQTDINPLPWNQAPGTHWYHPHKHGSTALQVMNGMAGPLLISGAFDDWLDDFYSGRLVEKVLVVQQIQNELRFFKREGVPSNRPQTLINGLATPTIEMRPGEIQRFRFIGATVQASGALTISFDGDFSDHVKQIAQDGVQFAPENYGRQPLLSQIANEEDEAQIFELAPGNRADFLVKAPLTRGTYLIEDNIFVENLDARVFKGHSIDQSLEEMVPPRLAKLEALIGDISGGEAKPPIDPSNGNPLLFTIEVGGKPKEMNFPDEEDWPEMPFFLRDLSEPGTAVRKVDFSMQGKSGGGTPVATFLINDGQYEAGCAGATMTRDSTEDWLVTNNVKTDTDDTLPHPFHIHINPFQVIRDQALEYGPPYVWQDTISLPTETGTIERVVRDTPDPVGDCRNACPDFSTLQEDPPPGQNEDGNYVCKCDLDEPSVYIRHRFDDYTGGFVIHCHFLGHEDRGMMWEVQTVCSEDAPWTWGEPRSDGHADDCSVTQEALACCPNIDCDPRQ